MRSRLENRLTGAILASAAMLFYLMIPAASGWAQERLDLKVGETNWVEPVLPESPRAVITTTDLTTPLLVSDMVDTLLNLPVPGHSVIGAGRDSDDQQMGLRVQQLDAW